MSVKRGTIHGIVGENGAGKSTLMSILYGFYKADRGEIFINGEKDRDPRQPGRDPRRASGWFTSISSWWRISPSSRT